MMKFIRFLISYIILLFSIHAVGKDTVVMGDSIYAGQIEVLIDIESKEFAENSLPDNIINSIEETLIDKKSGTYLLNYKIIEKDQKIVFRDVQVESYKRKKFNILWVTIPILIITGVISGFSGGS